MLRWLLPRPTVNRQLSRRTYAMGGALLTPTRQKHPLWRARHPIWQYGNRARYPLIMSHPAIATVAPAPIGRIRLPLASIAARFCGIGDASPRPRPNHSTGKERKSGSRYACRCLVLVRVFSVIPKRKSVALNKARWSNSAPRHLS